MLPIGNAPDNFFGSDEAGARKPAHRIGRRDLGRDCTGVTVTRLPVVAKGFALDMGGQQPDQGDSHSRHKRGREVALGRLTVAAVVAAALAIAMMAVASADEIVVPRSLERKGGVEFTYRLDSPIAAQRALDIEWTDTAHRIVERKRLLVRPRDGAELRFSLDLRRAVTLENTLTARLLRAGGAGAGSRRATASFFVAPASDPWSDYQIIMWQSQSPHAYEALRKLGVTAGAVLINRATDLYFPDAVTRSRGTICGFMSRTSRPTFTRPITAITRTSRSIGAISISKTAIAATATT